MMIYDEFAKLDFNKLVKVLEDRNRDKGPIDQFMHGQKVLDTDLCWRARYLQQPLDDDGNPTEMNFNEYSLSLKPIMNEVPISDEMLEKIRKYVLDCILNGGFIRQPEDPFNGYTISSEQFKRECYGEWRSNKPETEYRPHSSNIVRVTPGDGQLMRILLGDRDE